jgi:hypothetical protein
MPIYSQMIIGTMSKKQLTARRLRELFTYDAETKIWRWRHARSWRGGSIAANSIASPNNAVLRLDGRCYSKTTLAHFYRAPDETIVTILGRHRQFSGGLIKFRQDAREAAEDEPDPTPKPVKPRLKASPTTIAERLRALRVPETNIARHIQGMRQVAQARKQPRSTHTEQEEEHDYV